jgi:large subunit ribosomal protein L22
MAKTDNNVKDEHIAKASAQNLAISTKHCVEISNFLRYRPLSFAKAYLEDVIEQKKAIPFKRFNRDVGHKAGMAAGRYPVKAAKQFLALLNSVEANAQFKGLNTSGLKIIKILANKASIPSTGGRSRTGTKRSSLEIEVKEVAAKKKEATKKAVKKETPKTEVKAEVKETVVETKAEEAKVETKEEPKIEVKAEEVKEVPKETNNQEESQEKPEETTKKEEVVEEKKE